MKGLESVAAPMTGDVVLNLGHCPCVAPLFILSLALFEVEILNIERAMDVTAGIFTAPRPGIYFFSFTGISHEHNTGRYRIRRPVCK